jgi:AcrR family transcriptional regulator
MAAKKTYDDKLLLIMDRACRIFAEKGFHNASVRDVAAATGTSPAGLYYYFQSKEELLHLILGACLTSLLDRIRADVVGIRDPALRVRAVIRIHLDHFKNHGKEMRVLVHEREALSGPFAEDIKELMSEYIRVVTGAIRELSPEKTPEEIRAATFGLFGMLSWVDQWYQPERDLPLNLLADQFSGIFLGGFLPTTRDRTGAEEYNGDDSTREWTKRNSTSSILSGPGF